MQTDNESTYIDEMVMTKIKYEGNDDETAALGATKHRPTSQLTSSGIPQFQWTLRRCYCDESVLTVLISESEHLSNYHLVMTNIAMENPL